MQLFRLPLITGPQKAADSRRADIFYSFRFREKHKRICVLLQKRLLLYHALRRGSLSSGYQNPESLEKFFFSVPARDDCQLISSRYKVELSLRILFLNPFHRLDGFRARVPAILTGSHSQSAVLFTHGGEHFQAHILRQHLLFLPLPPHLPFNVSMV